VSPGRWGAKASLHATVIAEGHPDSKGTKRVDVSTDEQRRVYAWLDLNCPYYGSSDSNYRDNRGCRQILPPDLDATITEVAERRCVKCHTGITGARSFNNSFATRLDNPERNPFLRAPLSKKAGGTETCGSPVFINKQDPDYQAILKLFAPVTEMLAKRPRMDMLAIDKQTPIDK
jgi:hypothetical protein